MGTREGDLPDGDIEEGILVCQCGLTYPIVEGVPRMVEGAFWIHRDFRERWHDKIAEASVRLEIALVAPSSQFVSLVQPTLERFDKEWGQHRLEERTWGLEQVTRLDQALHYLGWTKEAAQGKVVLDAGCGTAKLTCGMATWGGEAVGLDLAPAAVRGWHQRESLAGEFAAHVHIVQGNVNSPPFRPASFDGIHSSGVLHHTPSTRRAFDAIAPLVRPGGSFGVWLYRQGAVHTRVPWLPFVHSSWASVPDSLLRPFTTRLPPRILHGLLEAYALVFHVAYTLGASLRGRRHDQTVRERTTSLFDSLAPPFVWRHLYDEVRGWFLDAGFEDVRETTLPGDAIGVAATGRRSPSKGA
jgi:SAM-dependent methyltransferase